MAEPIDYYFSVASGYSYLGAERFYALAERYGRAVNEKPVYLKIVVPETGGIYFPDRHPARLKQMEEDLIATGRHLGIAIIGEPSHHYDPIETASGMVAAAQLEGHDIAELAYLMQQALWRDDKSLADPQNLDDLAHQAGLDGPALRAKALEEAPQALLEANSREAVARGVIGAPTYIVDGEAFFGQDRLNLVEMKLAGGL